jgi:8-oxo-dGTP pyrophosphatase MutT (NUDIX family)
MIRPWALLRAESRLSTPIFNVSGRTCRSPRTGTDHEFLVLEAPDWVNVVPLTEQQEVVMVRQYRQGRGEVTLEIPGGMCDPGDVDPAAAARRELLEETGLWAGLLRPIGSTAPNPAIQSNLCWSFLATELVERSAPALDSTEDLETVRVPLVEIPDLIARGRISHALVVVAFWHLRGVLPGW